VTHAAPFGFTKVVFLSHVMDDGGPAFPGDPPVEVHPVATFERDGYYMQSLTVVEQAGTHWAAPAHFNSGQLAADGLDPGDFFHPAVVLDLRAEVAQDPDFVLGVADIRDWEAAFGTIPRDSAVIMWTGFEDRWDDPAMYLNEDSAGQPHYPGFSAEATRWLIEHRFLPIIASIWKTWRASARCPPPAVGSSSEESASGSALAPPRRYSGLSPSGARSQPATR
jgi:kynurenine formamidase